MFKTESLLMPIATVISAVAITAGAVIGAQMIAQPHPMAKSEMIATCLEHSQEVVVRGKVSDGWNVTTDQISKDTFSFCMKQYGQEIAQ